MRKSAGMAEVRMSVPEVAVSEVVVMHESRRVRDVPVVVVHHVMSVPVGSPMVPTPAKATEDADPDSQAEGNPWAIDIEPGNPVPRRVVWEGVPVDDPRIVFGYVNNFRIGRFNR